MKKLKDLINSFTSKEVATKKKVENLIFFVVMLVLLVIGINYIWFNDSSSGDDVNFENVKHITDDTVKEKATTVYSDNIYNENLDKRLESILSKVNGVSNVSVLITYSNNTKIVPVYNIEDSETVTNETDSDGGKRDITEKSYTKEVVYDEKSNTKTVIVETSINPTISGVIVVADFGNDISIKQQIISAVATVANISEYKVQVLSGT